MRQISSHLTNKNHMKGDLITSAIVFTGITILVPVNQQISKSSKLQEKPLSLFR